MGLLRRVCKEGPNGLNARGHSPLSKRTWSTDDQDMTKKIIVGVDGSSGSQRALEWAVNEAAIRNAELVVVHAWHFPAAAYVPYVPAASITTGVMEEAGEKLLAEMESAIDIAPTVRIRNVVVEGTPASRLFHEAEDADLLVVGTRGHGGFAGLLLGSVSQQCAHHAPCPVVIVHLLDKPHRLMCPGV